MKTKTSTGTDRARPKERRESERSGIKILARVIRPTKSQRMTSKSPLRMKPEEAKQNLDARRQVTTSAA